MPQKVSINTLASAAGVSRNTISLALRGSLRVKPQTRLRVEELARRMGYRPNLLARAVVTGRSQLLGVLLPTVDSSYIPRILQAIQDVCVGHEYGLLFAAFGQQPERIRDKIEFLLARRIDGLVVLPPLPLPPEEVWAELRRSRTPAIFLESPTPYTHSRCIDLDPAEASTLAMKHLLRLGHKRFCYAGPQDDYFSIKRRRGSAAAASRAGVPAPLELLTGSTIQAGIEAAERWLALTNRPTGVVCYSDNVASGFVQLLSSRGISIPGAVSVVGIDDAPLAAAAAVPLTTLRAPAEELGRMAAQALLEPKKKWQAQTLHWTLVERKSTGPVPKQ
jgi:DNA-binding LacI/PurR family transcriptional regulator